MIKVCVSNKINDVSTFDVFEKFFECVNSETSLTCCTETDAVCQDVLEFERERRMANFTFWLILYF